MSVSSWDVKLLINFLYLGLANLYFSLDKLIIWVISFNFFYDNRFWNRILLFLTLKQGFQLTHNFMLSWNSRIILSEHVKLINTKKKTFSLIQISYWIPCKYKTSLSLFHMYVEFMHVSPIYIYVRKMIYTSLHSIFFLCNYSIHSWPFIRFLAYISL